MAQTRSYLDINSDDDHATRVLTLAIRFFGAARPLPSSLIHDELYPTLDSGSFNRQFLRDRNILLSLGIAIVEAESRDDESWWQIDQETSFIEESSIRAEDASMLYVLCYDMAFDPSFAYRDELRVALAKISQMYRGASLGETGTSNPSERKRLATLIACLSNNTAARIDYTDAKGHSSTRTIALLGTFGLREHTYFVASRIGTDGTFEDDSIRTYRLDRISKVSEARPKIPYQIPLDFSVHDYERLPFQMGDIRGTAQLAVEDAQDREVIRATTTQGSLSDEGDVWSVDYSDAKALAAWCIGCGVVPLAPSELVKAWSELKDRAAGVNPLDPQLADVVARERTTRQRRQAGRTGSAMLIRQLMTVASSLNNEGKPLTAEQIAQSLGISYDQARHLIMLMTMSGSESYTYLPVVFDDDYSEVVLMDGARLSAPRIRLTRAETIALSAALSELGIESDDPLAQELSSAFARTSLSEQEVRRLLELPNSPSDAALVKMLSLAINHEQVVAFSYRPVTGKAISKRRVVGKRIRRNDDSWYLDAFDLDRQAERVFRIDRMSDVRELDERAPVPTKEHTSPVQMVTVRFDDPLYLDLFYWEGLEILAKDDASTIVRLPYYGGSWLPRHFAAYGGTVHVSTPEVAEQIVREARG